MAKIRYRVQILVDMWVDDLATSILSFEKAYSEAKKLSKKIPNSHVGEVKRLPHGNILRKENENNQD